MSLTKVIPPLGDSLKDAIRHDSAIRLEVDVWEAYEDTLHEAGLTIANVTQCVSAGGTSGRGENGGLSKIQMLFAARVPDPAPISQGSFLEVDPERHLF